MYGKIILFFVWFVRCFMWTLPFLCKMDYILEMDHESKGVLPFESWDIIAIQITG